MTGSFSFGLLVRNGEDQRVRHENGTSRRPIAVATAQSSLRRQRSNIGEPSLRRGGFLTLTFNTQWRNTMARDEHNKAAEHHENAAKSHRAAAEHHGKGDHAKGKEHSSNAQQHSQNARQHSEQAHSKSQQQK
jgi:hypothetical protein